VIFLLALIALQQFGYPITAYGTAALVAYELLYDSISCFASGAGRHHPGGRWVDILLTNW
jgi:hypothetical protein